MSITCAITGKHYQHLRGFLNNLRAMGITSREYYDKYLKTTGEDICECGNKKNYHNFTHGYNSYCNAHCVFAKTIRNEIIRNRFNGEDRDEKLKLFKERYNKTVDSIPDFWSSNIEKRRLTIKRKCEILGITEEEYYSEHSKNARETLKQSGRIDEMIQKQMETKQSTGKFGGRSGYKEYTLGNTKMSVQGYEPIVLDYLKESQDIDKIFAGKSIGFFKYYDEQRNEIRNYFPDIRIFDHMFIEVKSDYTFMHHREETFAKLGSVMMQNKVAVLVIPSKSEARKGKLEGSKKLLDWAISSQASNLDSGLIIKYEEGSTTILCGVESSDSKCRGSLRQIREQDIVWSPVKIGAV